MILIGLETIYLLGPPTLQVKEPRPHGASRKLLLGRAVHAARRSRPGILGGLGSGI